MNVGISELAVIFVLALLVFGPRKLPEIARMMGKAVRMFRDASEEVKRTLEEDIRIDEHRKMMKDIKKDMTVEVPSFEDLEEDDDIEQPDHSFTSEPAPPEGSEHTPEGLPMEEPQALENPSEEPPAQEPEPAIEEEIGKGPIPPENLAG